MNSVVLGPGVRVRNPAPDREILTLEEASELLRIDSSTLCKMIKRGRISSFRVGNDWRYRRDVILRWMGGL